MTDTAMSVGVVATRSALVGRVICDARAAECRCVKDAGHVETGDPVHDCHPDRCTGQWSGDYGGPEFRVVTLPQRVGEPRPWEFA